MSHAHVGGTAFGGFGHGAPGGQEGDSGEEQTEAIGGAHPAELGEQSGERVAEADDVERDFRIVEGID